MIYETYKTDADPKELNEGIGQNSHQFRLWGPIGLRIKRFFKTKEIYLTKTRITYFIYLVNLLEASPPNV